MNSYTVHLVCGVPYVDHTISPSDIVFLCELVIEGKNGYHIDPRQPEAIAVAMASYLSNTDLAAARGQQSQHIRLQSTPETAAQFLGQVTDCVLQHA